MEQPRPYEPIEFGFGRLFYDVVDAVIVADTSNETIVLWNPAATRIFGYSEEEALGMPLHSIVPLGMKDRHRRGIARFQETGHGIWVDSGAPLELTAVHKDGSEIAVDLTLSAVDGWSDNPDSRFVLGLVRDVTARRQAEAYEQRMKDLEARSKQAFQLNDSVVQGLAVAKMNLELGDIEAATSVVGETLDTARSIVSALLEETQIFDD